MNIRCQEKYGYASFRSQIYPEMILLLHRIIRECDENTALYRRWERQHMNDLKLRFWGSIILLIVVSFIGALK